MHRVILLASLGAIAAVASHAGELCLACSEPAASYSCTVEQPSEKYQLGGDVAQEMCVKALAKQGKHQKCQPIDVPEGGKCEGAQRVVTVTDYQRAVSATGESTYEVGALE